MYIYISEHDVELAQRNKIVIAYFRFTTFFYYFFSKMKNTFCQHEEHNVYKKS